MGRFRNTALAFAASALAAGPAMAQSVAITLAHEEPADAATSAAHMSAIVFKDIIETRSNGDMVVDIQAASAMGNQRERMELTQADIIQVNVAAIGGLAQFYPEINAIELSRIRKSLIRKATGTMPEGSALNQDDIDFLGAETRSAPQFVRDCLKAMSDG